MSFDEEADDERAMLSFDDFIGNKMAVEKVKLLITSDKIPHMGFFGPAGHGKTTLARIVADVTKRKFILINSVAVKTPLTFRGIITHPDACRQGAIVLLDECHALPKSIQDNLLSVLEEPAVLVTSYKDQIMRDKLPDHMTFIFATTHGGSMNEAMLSRLEPIEFLEYSHEEKFEMAVRYLQKKHDFTNEMFDIDGVYDIAFRARSGRDVVRFCNNAVRYMKKEGASKLTKDIAHGIFNMFGIDINGLTVVDRNILKYIAKTGTVGLDTLQDFSHISKKELKDRIEPYLLRRGFIVRGSSGRMITPLGLRALGGERIET